MKMYDIIVDGKIKQVCGTWETAKKWKQKYKECGYTTIEIKERDIKK